MPTTRNRPATTKNATRFEESALRFDRDFRATSRSMSGSWHSGAFRSTMAFLRPDFRRKLSPIGKPRDHRRREIQDRRLALSGLHVAEAQDRAADLSRGAVVRCGREQAEASIGGNDPAVSGIAALDAESKRHFAHRR